MFELKRSEDMTSSGMNGLNIKTNASLKWDRTRCQEELRVCMPHRLQSRKYLDNREEVQTVEMTGLL